MCTHRKCFDRRGLKELETRKQNKGATKARYSIVKRIKKTKKRKTTHKKNQQQNN